MHSIALGALNRSACTRERAGRQVPCGAALNDDTRVLDDMACAQSRLLRSIAGALNRSTCALDRTAMETFIFFCA